jgi:hypothetical protein
MSTNDSLVWYLPSYFVLSIWAPLKRSNAVYCQFRILLLVFSFINAYLSCTCRNFDLFFSPILIPLFRPSWPVPTNRDTTTWMAGPLRLSLFFLHRTHSSQSNSVFNPVRMTAVMLYGMRLFFDNLMLFVSGFFKEINLHFFTFLEFIVYFYFFSSFWNK